MKFISDNLLRQYLVLNICGEPQRNDATEQTALLAGDESAWTGGLAASWAEDGARSSGTFQLTPAIFSWW